MFHLYSSEVGAAVICMLLLIFVAYRLWCRWSQGWPLTELGVTLISCCVACRSMAAGHACPWPEGVDYTGRVALVTGASSGIGYATALELAVHGWTVILASRNLVSLEAAQKRINVQVHRRRGTGNAVVIGTLDLSSEDSIRNFTATVMQRREQYPVALLINAAGCLLRHLEFCEGRWNDVEKMLGTNALGPLLLSHLLLPLLDETAERSGTMSRIVNVSSSCHAFLGMGWPSSFRPSRMIQQLVSAGRRGTLEMTETAGLHRTETLPDFSCVSFVGFYGLSKLCTVWNTRFLAQQVIQRATAVRQIPSSPGADPSLQSDQVRVFVACSHPGISTTRLYRDLFPSWVLDYAIYYPSLLIGKTWREAAQSTLRASVACDGLVQGGYYLCSGEYGDNSGRNCYSSYAMDLSEACAYYTWALSKLHIE